VLANQTAPCVFAPQLGALQLTCNRAEATFRLISDKGQNVDGGNLPSVVPGLPVGRYGIIARFHNHQLQTVVMVEADKTNEAPIEFLFGTARLETVPSGAAVRAVDGSYLGKRPWRCPN